LKHRYLTLDAMRGIAAIAVVIGHMQGVLITGNLLPKAYLAVDFFFVLSGFVLAYSYLDKLTAAIDARRRVGEFLVLRLIRLYPLYFLAGVLNFSLFAVAFFYGKMDLIHLLAPVINFLFIPVPSFHLYPLDFPAWSLAFELFANVLLAIFAFRVKSLRFLAYLLFVSWIALVLTALAFGNVNVGSHKFDCWGGISRVVFSFFVGVALFKIQSLISFALPKISIVPLVFALVVSFAMDGGPLYDLFVVTVLYPMLILAGAKIATPMPKISAFLGDTSYAIYVLHSVFRDVIEHVIKKFAIAPSNLIGCLFIVGMLLIAAIADKFYDRPVRRWVNALLARRSSKREALQHSDAPRFE
jgi:peptidoglycan/LPS O-acetylase OafA/YrhL